jgi:LCP family protein required for cell wall assembly
MSAHPLPAARYTRYSRLNPDGSGKFGRVEVEPPKPTRGQSVIEYLLFGVFGLLIVLAAIALYTSYYSPTHRLVPNRVANGLKHDRVNIVVIGIGGDNHPTHDDLADSIMLVSLKPSTHQAAIISVPRDLWVRVGTYGTHRINYAHAIGEQSGYPGEGPGLLCDTVSDVFGQPVHAFVRIDFSAFEKIVDDIGGVDIYCQRSFYDYLFKDGFVQGWHHLNGRRALSYARYRYVIGPEGDNFARELRQQQVVNAVRAKLQHVSPQDAMHLISALSTLSNATETNLSTPQMISLYSRFHGVDQNNIRHVSLKPLTSLFEVTRLAEPGEAVRPRTGDYTELQAVTRDIFSSENQISTEDQIRLTASPAPPPQPQSMLSSVN